MPKPLWMCAWWRTLATLASVVALSCQAEPAAQAPAKKEVPLASPPPANSAAAPTSEAEPAAARARETAKARAPADAPRFVNGTYACSFRANSKFDTRRCSFVQAGEGRFELHTLSAEPNTGRGFRGTVEGGPGNYELRGELAGTGACADHIEAPATYAGERLLVKTTLNSGCKVEIKVEVEVEVEEAKAPASASVKEEPIAPPPVVSPPPAGE